MSQKNQARGGEKMAYNKPLLQGYSAMIAIQHVGTNKMDDPSDPALLPTDPAYQADE
jgi:hypothetical protein